MRTMAVTILAMGTALFALADHLVATPLGSTVNYQGQLKQNDKPVDDTCEFYFGLYDADTNGNLVADFGPTVLDVTDGLFSINLDFGAAAFEGDARWIEIEVVCPPGGTMETLSPRQPVNAVPYALHALGGGGGGAGDGHSLDAADGSPTDVVFVNDNGNVGIGTTSPSRNVLVQEDVDGIADLGVRNPNSGANAISLVNITADAASGALSAYSSNYVSTTFRDRIALVANSDASGLSLFSSAAAGDIRFYSGGAAAGNQRMMIDNTGRIGIGTTSPENRLTVNGMSNFTNHVGVGVTSPAVRLDVLTGLSDTIARFRRSESDVINPVTAIGQVTVGSSAQTGLNTPVESQLILEAESTTGGGQNVARIRSDVRPMEIIAGGDINIEASGILTLANGSGGVITMDNTALPNIVAGYSGNASTLGFGSTISGGGFAASAFDPPGSNLVTDHNCTIGGGGANQAGNDNADASDARNATVSGGVGNTASGRGASIGGGRFNTASGLFAAVPGGFNNLSGNICSFTAGCNAQANHQGSFVWADAFPTQTGPTFASSADNQFNVRANGGVRIASSTDSFTGAILAGVELAPGASAWSVLSDRNVKENFRLADGRETLERLVGVPIETWNYKTQGQGIRHIGPTAQDFYGAFGLGESERRISTIDADGVALSAIQGLYEIIQEKDSQIADLTARIERLEVKMSRGASASKGEIQ